MQDTDFKHNFHTHTFRCKHAIGDVADYCAEAVARGMKTIGFSDHAALPDDRWISVRMHFGELDEYIAVVDQGRQDFPQLRVLKGMECEYVPEFHAYLEDELLGARGFDYLIGGAHFFPDGDEWVGTYGGTDSAKGLRQYGEHVVEMMGSGLFAFIAHPDLFGNCYADWDANTIACSKDILAAAAELDVALEINALGLDKIARRKSASPYPLYPWLPFWQLASDYDVKVIVNADAHRPQDLQRRTAQAHAIAEQCGLQLLAPETIGKSAA